MKTIFLCLIYIAPIFSQGMYLSKENGFSLRFMYGKYNDYGKLSFSASYSLSGIVDFSYSRSAFLNDQSLDNYQNEFFARAYILKEKFPVFFSGSFGYIYQKAEMELWNNYSLTTLQKGFAYELGLHITPLKYQKSHRIVFSVIYRYFNPDEELKTPVMTLTDKKIIRSILFETAIVYYFSRYGVVVAPEFTVANNFDDHLYGLKLVFMIRH